MLTKTISAISGAALVAAAIAALPGFVPGVEAHATATMPTVNSAAKGDRLDAKTYGNGCSRRGWPHFETTCLRDVASPLREARKVRVISTDRMEVASN